MTSQIKHKCKTKPSKSKGKVCDYKISRSFCLSISVSVLDCGEFKPLWRLSLAFFLLPFIRLCLTPPPPLSHTLRLRSGRAALGRQISEYCSYNKLELQSGISHRLRKREAWKKRHSQLNQLTLCWLSNWSAGGSKPDTIGGSADITLFTVTVVRLRPVLPSHVFSVCCDEIITLNTYL